MSGKSITRRRPIDTDGGIHLRKTAIENWRALKSEKALVDYIETGEPAARSEVIRLFMLEIPGAQLPSEIDRLRLNGKTIMENCVFNGQKEVVRDFIRWGVDPLACAGKNDRMWKHLLKLSAFDLLDVFIREKVPVFLNRFGSVGVINYTISKRWLDQSLYYLGLVKAKRIDADMPLNEWAPKVVEAAVGEQFWALFNVLLDDRFYFFNARADYLLKTIANEHLIKTGEPFLIFCLKKCYENVAETLLVIGVGHRDVPKAESLMRESGSLFFKRLFQRRPELRIFIRRRLNRDIRKPAPQKKITVPAGLSLGKLATVMYDPMSHESDAGSPVSPIPVA